MSWFQLCLLLGLISSIFYGLSAVRIFGFVRKKSIQERLDQKIEEVEGEYVQKLGDFTNVWFIHQFWLNFIGSMAGWFCIYLLFKDASIYTDGSIDFNPGKKEFTLFLIGFFGITGYLPQVFVGISKGLQDLALKFMNLMDKK